MRQPLSLGEIGMQTVEKCKKQRTKPEGAGLLPLKRCAVSLFYMLCSTCNKQVVSQPTGLYF